MNAIKLLAETAETVTISRADLTALLDAAEDAEDSAAVRASKAAEDSAGGHAVARRDYFTAAEAKRLLDGESPIRVWREKRGMTQRALANAAQIRPSYLSEIESGKKPGSLAAHRALAGALGVPMESLLAG